MPGEGGEGDTVAARFRWRARSREQPPEPAITLDPDPDDVGRLDVGPIRTSFREFYREHGSSVATGDTPVEPGPADSRSVAPGQTGVEPVEIARTAAPVGHNQDPHAQKVPIVALESNIQQLLAIDGATGAAIIDYTSGMALAQGGSPGFDLSIAAAGNSNVVRAKLSTMNDIGLPGKIDDILITLDNQYHLINVLDSAATQGLFIYLVLDRSRANLALARHKLTQVSKDVSV